MRHFDCCRSCVTPERHPGCHGDCEKYLAAREEYMAAKDSLVMTESEHYMLDYHKSAKTKRIKRRHSEGR